MIFTDMQAYQIYGHITSGDTAFVKQLAKAAITSAVETQTDMFLDAEAGSPIPGNDDMRNFAVNYTTDMLKDFAKQLLEEIEKIEFDAHIQERREIKTNLQFPG